MKIIVVKGPQFESRLQQAYEVLYRNVVKEQIKEEKSA